MNAINSTKTLPLTQIEDLFAGARRIETPDSGPWFAATDICKNLGLGVRENGKVNTTAVLSGLCDENKQTMSLPTAGGTQKIVCIPEGEVFTLALKGTSEAARVYREWITKAVIPSIWKDEAYIVGEEVNWTETLPPVETPEERELDTLSWLSSEVMPALRREGGYFGLVEDSELRPSDTLAWLRDRLSERGVPEERFKDLIDLLEEEVAAGDLA